MQKKIGISIVVVTLLLMGVMATSVLASDLTSAKNIVVSKELQATAKSVTPERLVSVKPYDSLASETTDEVSIYPIPVEIGSIPEVNEENLRDALPNTYEEAETRVSTLRTRFLLYTHDGTHIMWGVVGNNYFVGSDNLGKRCWGIYGNGVFAGFYDGEFFWGNYRGGNWKAEGLFGQNYAHGKYILFPTSEIASAITAADP